MPEVTIQIGGRSFEVSCQDGEESYLHSAARMLDDEAQVLSDHIGRMPESRMLLMAGLMLADKTAASEDRLREMETRLGELQAELMQLKEQKGRVQEVEVPVIPPMVQETFAELAARAEALAASIEERLAG